MTTTVRRLDLPIDIGTGEPIVILPGFAMTPGTYGSTALLLAEQTRVLVPDIYGVGGPWRYEDIVDRFTATLDAAGVDRATLIGNSFGGGIELGFTARHPERVVEAVFVDTLAVAREWVLAREALAHPVHLVRLATRKAAVAFFHNVVFHPRQLAEAGWWGFTSSRTEDIETVARAGVRCHVLWANRDSLLDRRDGQAFARDLHATFTVGRPARGVIDHDWMFRHPHLFVTHLEQIGLKVLGGPQLGTGRPRKAVT